MGFSLKTLFSKSRKEAEEEITHDNIVEAVQAADRTAPLSKKQSGIFSSRNKTKSVKEKKSKKMNASLGLRTSGVEEGGGGTGDGERLSRASSLSSTDVRYLSQARGEQFQRVDADAERGEAHARPRRLKEEVLDELVGAFAPVAGAGGREETVWDGRGSGFEGGDSWARDTKPEEGRAVRWG